MSDTASRRPGVRFRRFVALAVPIAALVCTASPASAHVEAGEGEYHAGSEAVVPFVIPHGCDGSATTKVRIRLPEQIPHVIPTVHPNWTVSMVTEQLAEPMDLGEGRTLTERVAEVDYTALVPLPDGYRDVFELAVELPESAAGTTLRFPVIQECEQGSADWTMIPAAGQDPEELVSPAPSIEVGDPIDGERHATVTTLPGPTTTAVGSASGSGGGDDSSQPLAIGGLVAGLIGMLLGGRALADVRGGTRRSAG